MIIPKKNQLKAASEKMQYIKTLLDLYVITRQEYDEYILSMRIHLGLPAQKTLEIKKEKQLSPRTIFDIKKDPSWPEKGRYT